VEREYLKKVVEETFIFIYLYPLNIYEKLKVILRIKGISGKKKRKKEINKYKRKQ